MNMSLKEFENTLRLMVSLFVGHPESLQIVSQPRSSANGSMGTVDFLVRGHPDDQGRLIGISGRNATAFQTIMSAVGARFNAKAYVQILEPDREGKSVTKPFVPKSDDARDNEIAAVANRIACYICGDCSVRMVSGNDSSKVDIYIHTDFRVSPDIEASLSRVFRGIGKNLGRMVSLHIGRVGATDSNASHTA